ncbi:hypothetical protein GXB85_15850 [Cellulomonas sp. APG4]|uniref:hypothetical protein n=1 Tax=Cellulomonas sp. APG4 TaxID=1538656 RepID=UPI00137A50E9|nr:hypothetical protein [Cellulomonas sp. APG4]NCT92409.1 hypothetical protein [Cellulomonas sp. APG4]
MKALLVTLLVIWLAVSLLGAVIEGLLWLTAIGVLLIVATAAYGWFKLRHAVGGRQAPQA